jgi:hypothetical protein
MPASGKKLTSIRSYLLRSAPSFRRRSIPQLLLVAADVAVDGGLATFAAGQDVAAGIADSACPGMRNHHR